MAISTTVMPCHAKKRASWGLREVAFQWWTTTSAWSPDRASVTSAQTVLFSATSVTRLDGNLIHPLSQRTSNSV